MKLAKKFGAGNQKSIKLNQSQKGSFKNGILQLVRFWDSFDQSRWEKNFFRKG